MAHQAWFRYIRGSIDERREHNRVVGWIVHAKRWEVVAAGIGLYAGLVVGFALLYWATDGLSQSDIGSAFYFSVVTQATVGYGDVVATGPGRFLVVGQVLSAVAFIAVVPAIILLRVSRPAVPNPRVQPVGDLRPERRPVPLPVHQRQRPEGHR